MWMAPKVEYNACAVPNEEVYSFTFYVLYNTKKSIQTKKHGNEYLWYINEAAAEKNNKLKQTHRNTRVRTLDDPG